jgi:hypothetical protein
VALSHMSPLSYVLPCFHVLIQSSLYLVIVNPLMPPAPFCGLRMTMSNSREDKVRIFHLFSSAAPSRTCLCAL